MKENLCLQPEERELKYLVHRMDMHTVRKHKISIKRNFLLSLFINNERKTNTIIEAITKELEGEGI
jgi:hypothetical protein